MVVLIMIIFSSNVAIYALIKSNSLELDAFVHFKFKTYLCDHPVCLLQYLICLDIFQLATESSNQCKVCSSYEERIIPQMTLNAAKEMKGFLWFGTVLMFIVMRNYILILLKLYEINIYSDYFAFLQLSKMLQKFFYLKNCSFIIPE